MDYVNEISEIQKIRLNKLEEIKKMGVAPFGKSFSLTHNLQQIKDNFEELENHDVKIAGRIMAIRGHGKAAFLISRTRRVGCRCI